MPEPADAPVALVTGAARGIGLETARRFLEAGWRVALLDVLGDTLREATGALGTDAASAYEADVSDPASGVPALEAAARDFGRLDALVNNAGVGRFAPLEATDLDLWRRMMATNLDGPYLMTAAAIPHLAASRGAVVNITSISGLRASTLRTAYGTSKAALAHLTRQQAAELGEKGIRVNAVAPGPVATAMSRAVHTQAIIDAYHDAIPLNRYGTEREIANAIFWLCSGEASYVTGQLLSVDGGFEATGIGLPALREG